MGSVRVADPNFWSGQKTSWCDNFGEKYFENFWGV